MTENAERHLVPVEPHDDEPPPDGPEIIAEKAVIGAAIQSDEGAAEALALLRPEYFSRTAHRVVFEAVQRLADAGDPVEPMSVMSELSRTGMLTKVGARGMGSGAAFLHSLMQNAGSVAYHAPLVAATARRTRIRNALASCESIAGGDGFDPDVHLEQIRALIDEAAAFAAPVDLRPNSEAVMRVLGALGEGAEPGLPTGYPDLDDCIGGLRPGALVVIGARPGCGKALALDSPLPTPGGWTTMKDVKVGDYVFGMDGKPTRVTFATEVMYEHPCYDMEFSDGTVITADAEHLWLTETRSSRLATASSSGYSRESPFSRDQRWKSEKPGVKTTEAIYRSVRTGTENRANHSVPLAAPLELPDADLPIDPYILGYWLGDGDSHQAVITAGSDDLPHLIDRIHEAGYFHGEPKGGPTTWRMRVSTQPVRWGGGHHRDSLQKRLHDNNLIRSKHIPPVYMRASEPQRRALLAGLLDSDGTIRREGYVSLELTSARLAEQAAELIATLGYQFKMSRKRVGGRSPESSICYRIGFATTDRVFRLPRKDARRQSAVRPTSARRYIVAVRPVASVPVRCIAVDNADHMYLAGRNCIPTHNTLLGFCIADHVGTRLKQPVLFSSLEMTEDELTERRIAAEAKVSLHSIVRHQVSDYEWEAIRRAQDRLLDTQLYVDDTSKASLAYIRGRVRSLARTGNMPRLVVIDYLGFIDGPQSESRQQAVAALARGAKNLAREFEIPVILLAQLNRGPEHRSDKAPLSSDLRESGEIEQTADIVILLHREDLNEREHPRAGEIDLLIRKNRQGPQATLTMAFQGHYGRIVSMAPEWSSSRHAEDAS